MPRSTPGGTLTKIQTALGIEPVIIVAIDWGGSIVEYADKIFQGAAGKILSITGLDAIVKVGSVGSGGEVTVVLSDTDASIKAFLNTVDIHKQPAQVYQGFEGEASRILLLEGEVSSPISWNEGERTITFTIVNVVESKELGFSPEEGEFDFIAEGAIGVPWPLCFGDVVRVPAVKITEAVRGTSLSRYGQITIPELEQLCSLSIAAQQADSSKKIADLQAGFSDLNYATLIDNLTGATISLNNFLDGLIFDSPTQETNLLSFVDICKELERWRLFSEEQIANLEQAETDRIPLESTPGKPILTTSKYFSPTIDKNAGKRVQIEFTQEIETSYRIHQTIPSFVATIRDALPANVGLVEQAQLALDQYIAANWPYTSPEQWSQDAALRLLLTTAQVDLADAQSRASAATSNIAIANSNIATKNTEKTAVETKLLRFVLTTIIIEGGEDFPQGIAVEIIIKGLHYKGQFSGRTFTISQANTPADVNVEISVSTKVSEFLLDDPTIQLKGKYCRIANGIIFVEHQDGAKCFISPLLYKKTGSAGPLAGVLIDGQPVVREIYEPKLLSGVIVETSVFLSVEWINLVRGLGGPDYATGLSILRQRDYGFDVGDDVFLAGDYKDVYIANLIPSTAIHEVMAFRTIDSVKKLLPVPSRYFTTDLNELIAGQNATTLRFFRPLTELYGEAWGSEIYVSLTSSVGPNTADIIEHLVNTYTDLTPDAASFASVNSAIAAFPSSFAFLERRETLGAIEDVAWQARCAAIIKGDTVFLKYLAVEEAEIDTIDESSIHVRSLEVTLTSTEDLVTEFKANWDSDYSAERRNKIVLRNNIAKYGHLDQEYDFFIYNVQSLVIKSATFWLIRYSNTWKIAKFTTPLNMLRLETLDTVMIDLAQNFIASLPVKGIVENVIYNSETKTLAFEVMTAVRAGFLTPYVFTWPAAVDISITYPTADDPFAGGASG